MAESRARFRFAAITAASIRPRCSSCWRATISSGPATSKPSAALAAYRGGAQLDRTLRRSRRRRIRRIRAASRPGSGQSRVEGQPRRDLPCRRSAGRGTDRPGRGAGLRLRGLAGRRADRNGGSADPKRAVGSGEKAEAMRSRFDDRFFDEASGLTSWRSTATRSRAASEPPTPVTRCSPASPIRTRARIGRSDSDGQLVLLRLGHPHRRLDRGALQSDELSQRLGLAARQRA